MKKIFAIFLQLVLLATLVACSTPTIDNHTTVISKLYGATYMDDNVIELYNNSDDEVNLKAYELHIFANGSNDVTHKLKLKGKLAGNSYFTIGSKQFDSDLDIKLDLTFKDNLAYNGDDAIALTYNDEIIDLVGYKGHALDFSKNVTLIRLGNKEDYTPSDTYDRFNFIDYAPNVFQYLNNDDHKIKTLEDLYKGPRLELQYKNMPYASNNLGTGGAPEATLQGIADGDTATFGFEEKPHAGSHRYYYIDTAETAGPNTEDKPWGEIGTLYNKEFLLNDADNKEIRVQSVPHTGLGDTYGRNLGLIWVNDQLSQYLIVAEGLSRVYSKTYNNANLSLTYQDVPYLTFLLFAEERAKINEWGMHGKNTAPDWDYENNKRAPRSEWENWQPELDIEW